MGTAGYLPRYQRVFFAAFGFGPYECYFCHGARGGVSFDDVQVHHIDRDLANNHPYNLVPCHAGCHGSYHSKMRVYSAEVRKRISVRTKSWWDTATPEQRAARGAQMSAGWARRRAEAH